MRKTFRALAVSLLVALAGGAMRAEAQWTFAIDLLAVDDDRASRRRPLSIETPLDLSDPAAEDHSDGERPRQVTTAQRVAETAKNEGVTPYHPISRHVAEHHA
jgi:hypothetical protein